MNRVVKNLLTVLITGVIISCLFTNIFFTSFSQVFTKKNLNKCLKKLNIEELLASQNTNINDVINSYAQNTTISEEDISKIFESGEYSSLVGNYMLDSNSSEISQYLDMLGLSNIQELEQLGELDSETSAIVNQSESMTKEQIRDMFNNLGISFTESDITYFNNSLATEVVPEVEIQVDESITGPQKIFSGIELDGFKKLFSEGRIKFNAVVIVIGCILLMLLQYEKVGFLIAYATCSGSICIVVRIFAFLVQKIGAAVPETYQPMVKVFTTPLENGFLETFNKLLIITILCVILHIAINILLSKTSLGDRFSMLMKKQDREEKYREMHAQFNGTLANDYDFSQFDNFDSMDDRPDTREE
ncbi:MAG: hypothetical protein E7262_09240 [Lachnospiraceae bacterium]|nr:hypothetical protein [Lachnospiraceae bacterium]